MFTSTTIARKARLINDKTSAVEARTLLGDAMSQGDLASWATALVKDHMRQVFGAPKAGDMLGIGKSGVSNVKIQVEAWTATGFSDDAVTLRAKGDKTGPTAWTLVTSSKRWGQKWATPEGIALMGRIQAAKGDEAKYAALTGTDVPEVEQEATVKGLMAALKRAQALAEALTLTDAERGEVDTYLIAIAAATASPKAKAKATVNA